MGANRLWPGVHTESAAALVFALGAFGLLKYLPRVGNLAFLLIAIGIGVRGSAIDAAARCVPCRDPAPGPDASSHPPGRAAGIRLDAAPGTLVEPQPSRCIGELPNVLLLVLDTVRALRLSLYGYERRRLPPWSGGPDPARSSNRPSQLLMDPSVARGNVHRGIPMK